MPGCVWKDFEHTAEFGCVDNGSASSGDFVEDLQLVNQANGYPVGAAIGADVMMYVEPSGGDIQVYDLVGSEWVIGQLITAVNGMVPVAISGDYAVFTAQNDATTTGMMYIYDRSGLTWSQNDVFTMPNLSAHNIITYAAAISRDTEWIFLGVLDASVGDETRDYVRIYRRSGSSWTFSQELANPDVTSTYGSFGAAMAISDTGIAVVSDNTNDDISNQQGVAYVYRYGVSWVLDQTVYKDTPANSSDRFGTAVALSEDGVTMVIGDYRSRTQVWLDGGASFSHDHTIAEAGLGHVIAGISADGLTIVTINGSYGSTDDLLIYELDGSWSETQSITPPLGGDPDWAEIAVMDYNGGNIVLAVGESSEGGWWGDGDIFIYSRAGGLQGLPMGCP